MTKHQAHAKAHALWGTPGHSPGDRYGYVCLRRKNVYDRFHVGYVERIDTLHANTVLMGTGTSWEQAFENALLGDGHIRDCGNGGSDPSDCSPACAKANTRASKESK